MKVSSKTILDLNCAKYFLHKIQGLTGVEKRARLSLDFSLPTSKTSYCGLGWGMFDWFFEMYAYAANFGTNWDVQLNPIPCVERMSSDVLY